MYRVLLAEDEPAALRYLRKLIEAHFSELTIVATASDGDEALELAQRVEPELILTDVKMPRLDGIEFVRRLKTISPQTPVVIVSGYDDFEYVRRALNTGVVDYVLKPITKKKLSEVFRRLEQTLRGNRDAKTFSTVKQLVYGGRASGGGAPNGEPGFRLAVLRYGAPMSRFSGERGIPLSERCTDGWCTIRGRDGNEVLFVAGADRLDADGFSSYCSAAIDEKNGAYHTLLCITEVVPVEDLAEKVKALFKVLDRTIVLGSNQVVDRTAPRTSIAFDHIDASRIEYAVINSNALELEEAIRQQLSTWERHMLPAMEVTFATRKILETVERAAVRRGDEVAVGSMTEEMVARAGSFRDLGESLLRAALEVAHLAPGGAKAKEEDSLFAAIRTFLEASYSRRHSVDSVRARFGISASYLTRLFRVNAGQSFTEYLRRLRIDAAKRLIRESPEMPMKSVARYAGFTDPFYFSRVFRRVTGETPTEFSRKCRSE